MAKDFFFKLAWPTPTHVPHSPHTTEPKGHVICTAIELNACASENKKTVLRLKPQQHQITLVIYFHHCEKTSQQNYGDQPQDILNRPTWLRKQTSRIQEMGEALVTILEVM